MNRIAGHFRQIRSQKLYINISREDTYYAEAFVLWSRGIWKHIEPRIIRVN